MPRILKPDLEEIHHAILVLFSDGGMPFLTLGLISPQVNTTEKLDTCDAGNSSPRHQLHCIVSVVIEGWVAAPRFMASAADNDSGSPEVEFLLEVVQRLLETRVLLNTGYVVLITIEALVHHPDHDGEGLSSPACNAPLVREGMHDLLETFPPIYQDH